MQAIAQINVSEPYFEKSIGAANAFRGRCARRAVTNAIAIVPVIPSVPATSAHVHAGFVSDCARKSRRRASRVLRGQPCPFTYHQKNESHTAVTTSIHGIEGDIRKFRITAMLGGMVPTVTTNSATRIPRTIAGNRFQKRLNTTPTSDESNAEQQRNSLGGRSRRRSHATPKLKNIGRHNEAAPAI